MLRAFNDLKSLNLGARDGEIGTIKDAYFDDRHWTLRYLVVTTGGWMSGRSVLILPQALRAVSWDKQRLDVDLTREQISNAPGIEFDKPVSRQHETAYFDYHGYPYYWAGPAWSGLGTLGGANIAAAAIAERERRESRSEKEQGDPHLRSADEVYRYAINAADGEIGAVKDFLFDESTWALRYFVVDTRKWLPGRKVLISTDWIEQVNWSSETVDVAMSREEVRASPEYDPSELSPDKEESLYRHYKRTPHTTQAQIR